MAVLRPTLEHSRASRYRRPGGPWDRFDLDRSIAITGRATILDDRIRLAAGDAEQAVSWLAGALRAAGVRRHGAVSWQMPNSAASMLMYRACWRLGAVAAPLHHRLGPAEVAAAVSQVDPVVLLATAGMPAVDLPGARPVSAADHLQVLESLAPAAPPVTRGSVPVAPSDLAVVLFTSGSAGAPKAVMHSHRGLGYKAATMIGVHGLGSDDAVLMPAPLAHVSGLLNGVLIPSLAGIPTILMAGWDPELALSRIHEERVSFMGAPPVFFSQMATADGFDSGRVASLRLVSTGGASVSPAFVESTAEAFGCRVKRTYGSTEAPTVTTSGPDDPPQRARDTDGRVVGEAELTVHDPDSGALLDPGEPGELWLRGPELFVGYADAEQTADVVARPGGWYRTGDLGVVDENGWLQVVGRKSDVIIRAGENISASEVEAVLEAHPGVRHAVAVAVPDPAVGERVAAFVETDLPFGLDDCRSWFAERGVTRFKTPEYVVRLESVPVLAAGKPDRAALRAQAAALGDAGRTGGAGGTGGAASAEDAAGRDNTPEASSEHR